MYQNGILTFGLHSHDPGDLRPPNLVTLSKMVLFRVKPWLFAFLGMGLIRTPKTAVYRSAQVHLNEKLVLGYKTAALPPEGGAYEDLQ